MLLFIASLFVPALTKQWNDRKQELEVKQRLLADIVTATAHAVYGAQDVALQTGPGQQRQARRELYGAWLRDRIALEAPLLIYFDASEAADHWWGTGELGSGQYGFRNAVLRYALLSCYACDGADVQDLRVDNLHAYLEEAGQAEMLSADQWEALASGTEGTCGASPAYCKAYRRLGNLLLERRLALRDQLIAANGKGFSSGWRDFVGDLSPLG